MIMMENLNSNVAKFIFSKLIDYLQDQHPWDSVIFWLGPREAGFYTLSPSEGSSVCMLVKCQILQGLLKLFCCFVLPFM